MYVLNVGSKTIVGFRLGGAGLRPIPGSVRPLSAGALVPRHIQFTPHGRVLVVDEGGSSTIDTLWSAPTGKAGPAITAPSVGGGSFGFDFDQTHNLLVSDAALGRTPVGNNPASHPLGEAVSTGRNYLYVLANGLSQIVGYRVGSNGSLTQVTTAAVAAGSGGIGAS